MYIRKPGQPYIDLSEDTSTGGALLGGCDVDPLAAQEEIIASGPQALKQRGADSTPSAYE